MRLHWSLWSVANFRAKTMAFATMEDTLVLRHDWIILRGDALEKVSLWSSTSVRRAAAFFPESEVDRTRDGHREGGAHDPEQTDCSLLWAVMHNDQMRDRAKSKKQKAKGTAASLRNFTWRTRIYAVV